MQKGMNIWDGLIKKGKDRRNLKDGYDMEGNNLFLDSQDINLVFIKAGKTSIRH